MKKYLSLLAGWGVVLTSSLHAQIPNDLVLPKVARDAHWRVDYIYPEQKPAVAAKKMPDSPRLDSIEYILTGRTGHVINRYSDSSIMECYWKDRYEIAQTLPNKEIRLKEHSGASAVRGLLPQYPGLEWVEPATFVSRQDAFDQHCFYFKKVQTLAQVLQVDPATLEENPEVVWEAWIAQSDGRPIQFVAPGVTRRYTFLSIPDQPVELPPEYQEVFAATVRPHVPPGQAVPKAR